MPGRALPMTVLGCFRRYGVVYACAALLLAGYQLALNRVSWLSKATLDLSVSATAQHGAALRPALLMIAVAGVAFLCRLATRWTLSVSGRRIEYLLRRQFVAHLHELGSGFYRKTSPGEILSRVSGDLAQIRILFSEWVRGSLSLTLGLAAALEVMLHISTALTAVAFAVIPLQLLALRVTGKRLYANARSRQTFLERMYELAQRHFAGIRLVRGLGIEHTADERFAASTDALRKVSDESARVQGSMMLWLGALDGASVLSVTVYGAALLARGEAAGGISAGGLFAFLFVWRRIAAEAASAGTLVDHVQRAQLGFQRLREFFAITPEVIVPRAAAAPIQADETALRVEHLCYGTDGRELLRDITFSLPVGGSLAIMGRTGAGKSVLAGVLARVLPMSSGSVQLNDRALSTIDQGTLRSWVTYAQQDPFLFSTDIADNVALGIGLAHGVAPPAGVIASALADVQIADEVLRLPDGDKTLVGERGVQLSGGQRQRIALARALVSRAPLLILDDPLSAVDARTEAAILDALRERTRTSSLLLVTQRIATAARCDRILVLEDGRIAQLGTHDELMRTPGVYAQLAEEQRMSGEADAEEEAAAPTAQVRFDNSTEIRVSGEVPQRPSLRRRLALLWPFIARERRSLLAVFVLLLLATATGAAVPLLVGALVDAAQHGRSLVTDTAFLLGLVIVGTGSMRGELYLLQLAGGRAMAAFRLLLFRHTGRLSMRVFDRMPVGELVTVVVVDVDAVQRLFSPEVAEALFSVVALVVNIVAMVVLNLHLAAIVLASLPIGVVLVTVVVRYTRDAHRETRNATGAMTAILNEQIAGASVIRAFGAQAVMAARFDAVSVQVRRAGSRAAMSETFLEAAIELIRVLVLAALLVWTAHAQGTAAAISFATVIAYAQYLNQFFSPVMALGINASTVQGALASIDRCRRVLELRELDAPDDAGAGAAPSDQPSTAPTVTFDAVSFAYDPARPALTDISFEARRGERIALVGSTGAGKSTVTHLLLRLYDVDAGAVRVLGRDVLRWPRRALRRSIAVVPQDVNLVRGTLLENIALGDSTPDRARAQAALARIGVEALFAARAGSLDASVEEGGQNFSAGERQLISFARAVYQDAPILVLDEATASVDSGTEALVQRALGQMLAGRTTLIVAHRLSTIEAADTILVFDHGRIVERGTHTQLLAARGLYARLRRLQRF